MNNLFILFCTTRMYYAMFLVRVINLLLPWEQYGISLMEDSHHIDTPIATLDTTIMP